MVFLIAASLSNNDFYKIIPGFPSIFMPHLNFLAGYGPDSFASFNLRIVCYTISASTRNATTKFSSHSSPVHLLLILVRTLM